MAWKERGYSTSKKNRATFVSNYTVFQRYIMHISFEFARAPEFFIPMMVSLVEDFISSSLQRKKVISDILSVGVDLIKNFWFLIDRLMVQRNQILNYASVRQIWIFILLLLEKNEVSFISLVLFIFMNNCIDEFNKVNIM